jgi:hypothetical protein
MAVYIVSKRPMEVCGVYDDLTIYEGDLYEIVGVYNSEAKARQTQEYLLNTPSPDGCELDVVVEEWEVQ